MESPTLCCPSASRCRLPPHPVIHPLCGVPDLCGKAFCMLNTTYPAESENRKSSIIPSQSQHCRAFFCALPAPSSFSLGRWGATTTPWHPPTSKSINFHFPAETAIVWKGAPSTEEKALVHVPVTRMQGIDNPYRETSTGQQGGREERGLQWEMQEWWGQGRRHKHRNHVGFLWEDKSSTEKSMWVAPRGGEAEPEGTDAIENWAREERPGEKELNQSSSFDLIQYGGGKAAQQLLKGREEDLISHEVKWWQHSVAAAAGPLCCICPLYFSQQPDHSELS